MKGAAKPTSGTHNPNKTELVAWVNSLLPASAGKIKEVSELGNGVAYLYILNEVRPGSVRLQKIVKEACNTYEIHSNLKMLLACFQKLELPFRFEIDKVAQMKYQDNYHLASFLYKLHKTEQQTTQDTPNQPLKPNKPKIIPPNSYRAIPLHKNPPPPVTPNTLASLKHPKSKPEVLQTPQPSVDQQKLSKIASIFKLESKKGSNQNKQSNQGTNNAETKTFTMQESYKRILRKTVCDQSKYLNSFTAIDSYKQNLYDEQKREQRVNHDLYPNNMLEVEVEDKYDESMLLSSKKKEMSTRKAENMISEGEKVQGCYKKGLKQEQISYQLETETKVFDDESVGRKEGEDPSRQIYGHSDEAMRLEDN